MHPSMQKEKIKLNEELLYQESNSTSIQRQHLILKLKT